MSVQSNITNSVISGKKSPLTTIHGNFRVLLIYPTMLLITPILLLITIFYMFLPGYRGLSDELLYQRTVWKFWLGFWFLFSFFGPNSIKRLKILAGTYNKKTLYYICFILINLLLSFYIMMLIMGYFRNSSITND